MFADLAMARRIDAAEASLVSDVATMTARRHPDIDVLIADVGGGVVVFGGPESPVNKMIGVGFDGPLDEAILETIERQHAQRGAPVRAEVSTLVDPAVFAQLVGRGYALTGFENVLGRSLEDTSSLAPMGRAPDGLEIVEADGAGAPEWLQTVVTGFAHPDAPGEGPAESYPRDVVERTFYDLAAATGFRQYLARLHGKTAGAASLRLFDRMALLSGAATLPAFRRRGIQTALLAARLAAARREGCDLAVVTTQPGSKSQQNVQRQGFALLYSRAVLIKPAGPR